MKKLILLFCLSMLCVCYLSAQVVEEERSMTKGANNALIMLIPNADDKQTEKLWRKFMKSYGAKTKKVKKSEEWLSDNAEIGGVSADDVDVYATFEQTGDDVRMVAWFDLGDSYLASMTYPDRYPAGERVLIEFENVVYEDVVKGEIKEEQNSLKKLESSLKKAKKDKNRYEREIEQAKDKIAKAEANIESNLGT